MNLWDYMEYTEQMKSKIIRHYLADEIREEYARFKMTVTFNQ